MIIAKKSCFQSEQIACRCLLNHVQLILETDFFADKTQIASVVTARLKNGQTQTCP